ncbi:hypothetical protein ACHAW5_006018 [Stephanodiscus triporus]|uniref:Uncharacterized protein n=1 Tax=Stephanodiscus triporus TaxID=2934178 RepID=A0ABD3NNA1_9STRA
MLLLEYHAPLGRLLPRIKYRAAIHDGRRTHLLHDGWLGLDSVRHLARASPASSCDSRSRQHCSRFAILKRNHNATSVTRVRFFGIHHKDGLLHHVPTTAMIGDMVDCTTIEELAQNAYAIIWMSCPRRQVGVLVSAISRLLAKSKSGRKAIFEDSIIGMIRSMSSSTQYYAIR